MLRGINVRACPFLFCPFVIGGLVPAQLRLLRCLFLSCTFLFRPGWAVPATAARVELATCLCYIYYILYIIHYTLYIIYYILYIIYYIYIYAKRYSVCVCVHIFTQYISWQPACKALTLCTERSKWVRAFGDALAVIEEISSFIFCAVAAWAIWVRCAARLCSSAMWL